MTTLRQAVHEYLGVRRHLGFKLHEPRKGLLDFVRFLKQRRAPVITQTLALTWSTTTLAAPARKSRTGAAGRLRGGNALLDYGATKTGADADPVFSEAAAKYEAALEIRPDLHEFFRSGNIVLHERE